MTDEQAMEEAFEWYENQPENRSTRDLVQRLEQLCGWGWREEEARACFRKWSRPREIAREKAEKANRHAEEAAEPSGLTTLRPSWGGVKILARLPHFILAAAVAEEAGKAAGSTKLRGLGLPLPYTDRDGNTGIVRLWARWEKQRGGAAKLLGFDVRQGKDRSGDRLLQMDIRVHDGALIGYASDRVLKHPEELSRRLLDAEAAGQLADPMAELARNAVTQARYAFCCCCGRLLTDPVSVQNGIRPRVRRDLPQAVPRAVAV